MSEQSVTSPAAPIYELIRLKNNKKANEYYYRNQETVKSKMRERNKSRREKIQESIKFLGETVEVITTALEKFTNVLKALDARV